MKKDATQWEIDASDLIKGLAETVSVKNQRIATLEAMLDEAVGIFSRYLNVPESRDLEDRWEKLKSQ